MLRFTKDIDYGLVLLKCLLHQPEGSIMSARELADATTLPQPVVAGLLKRLTRRRLLHSHRGVRGGYALVRHSITVAAAVEALQGPILLTTCGGTGVGDCQMSGHCSIVSHTPEISAIVRNALQGIDLKELFEPAESPTPSSGSPTPVK
jgi:Rrf2 family protein